MNEMTTDDMLIVKYGAKKVEHMGEVFYQVADGNGYTCDARMLLDLMALARQDEREMYMEMKGKPRTILLDETIESIRKEQFEKGKLQGAKDENKKIMGMKFLDLIRSRVTFSEKQMDLSDEELLYEKGKLQGAKDEREKQLDNISVYAIQQFEKGKQAGRDEVFIELDKLKDQRQNDYHINAIAFETVRDKFKAPREHYIFGVEQKEKIGELKDEIRRNALKRNCRPERRKKLVSWHLPTFASQDFDEP